MPRSTPIARGPSVTELLYRRLTEDIASLALAPGDRIVIEDLAATLGVSRTPLREVLPVLVNDRLVENLPAGVLRVAPITVAYVHEVYQARAGLEGMATRLATPRIPKRPLAALEVELDVVALELQNSEYRPHDQVDRRLHGLVAEHCGNLMIRRLLDGLNVHVARIRRFSQNRPGPQMAVSYEEHRHLLRALIERRAEDARRIAEAHILDGGNRIAELIDRLPASMLP